MKNKKGLILLSSVVAVCAVGLIVSPLMDWSVDTGSTSGDIGKTARFSRKTAGEALTNMEELIQNDPTYKEGMATACYVMQTRALQFGALVDMSNEVAADIPDFADVLKDMNDARAMVDNVCSSLAAAGQDLNAVMDGEQRPDLSQNTINASLAYTTLQKQNKLADRFIDTTDKYLKKNEADDRLKFVRDQWLDYQRMTCALNGDEKAAQALEKKGTLLSPQATLAAVNTFGYSNQLVVLQGGAMSYKMDIQNSLAESVTGDAINNMGQLTKDLYLSMSEVAEAGKMNSFTDFENQVGRILASFTDNQMGAIPGMQATEINVPNQTVVVRQGKTAVKQNEVMNQSEVMHQNQMAAVPGMQAAEINVPDQTVVVRQGKTAINQYEMMQQNIMAVSNMPHIQNGFEGVVRSFQVANQREVLNQKTDVMNQKTDVMNQNVNVIGQKVNVIGQVGNIIEGTAMGQRVDIHF